MGQTIADRRDIDFVLYEQFDAERLTRTAAFSDFTKKAFDLTVTEARAFGLKEILPTYAEGDRHGARFENGQVYAPACFRKPFRLFVENGWTALTEDPDMGGQGYPHLIQTAASEYLLGANFALASYANLGHGTGKMIELFGTETLKRLFLEKLYTGRWAGTMLLTEPEAGSDVGALTTMARPNEDGTYSLSGNKVFITAGDHDLAENIIHPVLARIEGAPAGTKGISLFIVPKIWVHDDGKMGDANDIVCTGIEEKMGLHGSATCSMALGGKRECRGFLLGEANHGMRIMFHMMNEARLGVGIQAFLHASAAYLYALDYARQRKQGRALENIMDHRAPAVPIIRHPDVRRMLLRSKALVEGMRSFVYYVANCMDRVHTAESEREKTAAGDMISLLTPVLKTYNANVGFDVCVTAIQVFGGYGYTREYPVEQLARDCKIASIYEGTDGIQAMDLLGRKLAMKKGAVFMEFLGTIQKVIARARRHERLAGLAERLDKAVNRLGEVAMAVGQLAMSPDFKTAFAHATPFLGIMGDVIMGWMLLWRAAIAAEALVQGTKKKDVAFYEGLIHSARYFLETELEITLGKMNAVQQAGSAAVDMDEACFGR